MLLSSHTCHFCEITTISFNLPLWSVLLDVSYKASDLGDHILNTVSSINLSQIYFKKMGEGKGSEAYISLEEKYLCTDRPVIL